MHPDGAAHQQPARRAPQVRRAAVAATPARSGSCRSRRRAACCAPSRRKRRRPPRHRGRRPPARPVPTPGRDGTAAGATAHRDHAVSGAHQRGHQVGGHVSGRADDQDPHRAPPISRAAAGSRPRPTCGSNYPHGRGHRRYCSGNSPSRSVAGEVDPKPGAIGTGTAPATKINGSPATTSCVFHAHCLSHAYVSSGVTASRCTTAGRLFTSCELECIDSPQPSVSHAAERLSAPQAAH